VDHAPIAIAVATIGRRIRYPTGPALPCTGAEGNTKDEGLWSASNKHVAGGGELPQNRAVGSPKED